MQILIFLVLKNVIDTQHDKWINWLCIFYSKVAIRLSKNYQNEVICMKFFSIDSLIEVNGNQYFACISQSIQATILGRKNHF